MPGPGYKRHDLPGPSKVKNYKPKKVRRDARRLDQQYRAATKAATHAVVKYAGGEKANLPTLAQFRAAWPTLTETQRSRLAPAIIRRAAGGTTSPAIPKPLPAFLREYAPQAFDEYAAVAGGRSPGEPAQAKGSKALKELQIDTPGEALDLTLTFAPVGLAGRAAKYGVDVLRGAKGAAVGEKAVTAAVRAEGAGARVAAEGTKAGRAARVAEEGAEAGARAGRGGKIARAGARASKGARKVRVAAGGTKAARLARTGASTRAGRAAIVSGKVGAKAGTYPLRHPIKSTAAYSGIAGAAAVPGAITSGDLGKIPDAVVGNAEGVVTGPVADVKNAITGGLDDFGIVGNAAKDILELPAAAVPSTYLFGKAVVEAAQGDDTALKQQLDAYMDQGLLPAVFKGDPGQALKAIEEHPIFSALEASGARAVVGRGTGAALRAGLAGERGRQAGSTVRKPIKLGGGLKPHERSYSRDTIEKAFQVAADKRRARRHGGQKASPGQRKRILNKRADSETSAEDAYRRHEMGQEAEGTLATRPEREIDQAGVSLATQGIIGSIRTFDADLAAYGEMLDASLPALRAARDDTGLNLIARNRAGRKIKANRALRKTITHLRKDGDPETIMAAAEGNAKGLNEIDGYLVDLGLLDPRQAAQSRNAPYAITHMDATYGKAGSKVDAVERHRQAGRDLRRAKSRRRQAGQRLERTRRAAEHSRGRLERLEADANLAVRRPKRASTRAATRHRIDRKKGSRLNAERARLLRLEADRREHERDLAEAKAEVARLRAEVKDKPKRPADQFLDRDGEPLTPEAIQAERRRAGGEFEPGFVTHRPRAKGSGSFYRPMWPERQSLPKAKRTGDAVREGTWDAGFDALVEQRMRGRSIVAAVQGFQRLVGEFSVRVHGQRRFKSFAEALDAAADSALDLVPVRLAAFRAGEREMRAAERAHDEATGEVDVRSDKMFDQDVLADAWKKATSDGPGPVVLIDASVAKRLGAHFQPAGSVEKAAQAVNQSFKSVVLPHVPWVARNATDINMRSMFNGNIPFGLDPDAFIARKVLARAAEIDPVGGAKARARITPGSLMGAEEAMRVFRSASQFSGTELEGFARAAAAVRQVGGVRQAIDLYLKYRDLIFKANHRMVERPPQEAALGKLMRRELQEQTGKWNRALRLGEDAIDDLAHGLLETPKQIKYAEGVMDVFGRWNANSPLARSILVSYAPFGMWTRAASKFVFITLPAKHPIKTAMIAAIERMTEPERKALGLSIFADEPLPANLRGNVPLEGGGLLPVASASSFGYFSDPLAAAGQAVLPQLSGFLTAARGIDWAGRPLEHDDGTPLNDSERIAAGLGSTLTAYVPFLSMGKNVAKRGPVAAVSPFGEVLDESLVDYLRARQNNPQFTIIEGLDNDDDSSSSGSSSGSSAPWVPSSGGSSSSSGSGSSSKAPWVP